MSTTFGFIALSNMKGANVDVKNENNGEKYS